MATHSSVLAWRIPGMGEPGGLPSMGSHRVRHDWSDLAAAAVACTVSCHLQTVRALLLFLSGFLLFLFLLLLLWLKLPKLCWIVVVRMGTHVLFMTLEFLDMYYRESNGTPLQYSCLENPMDGGAWVTTAHGVTKSRTWLSNFTFTFHFHALEKEMATHSSVLAWRIPGMGEPAGLPSMGSHSIRHDWSDLAAA